MPQVGVAIAAFVGGLAASAGAGAALSAWIGAASVRLLTSVAISALYTHLSEKSQTTNLPAGVRTSVTQTGGTNPTSFVLGTFATAGYMVAPPMSFGTAGATPNAYLTYVVELGDIRGMALNRLAIDGEYATIGGSPIVSGTFAGMYDIYTKWFGYAFIRYYSGAQIAADPTLLAQFGAYPSRPWTADMPGYDQCYAVIIFRFNQELYNGFPTVRFETTGIPLYDPRADTTVGGSGAQRWATPSTWVASNNPMVQIYNIMRGISFADGSVWGGGIAAADLPLTEWFAAMNACDASVATLAGGTEPAYRSGCEVRSNDEPAAIIEELLKACSGQLVDMGGIWKPKVGAVGLPVFFLTDDDVIISKPQEYEPFPNLSDTYNGVTANHPEPISLYESISAPIRTSATDETADGGRRLIADLSFGAVPYGEQVQRLMEAYRLDNRRFRRHGLTLGPSAMLIEPTDSLSWTSTANGYTAKIFEVGSVSDDLMTALQRVSIRERDSADYTWVAATDTKATAPVAGARVVPAAQTVPSWAVTAITMTGDVPGVAVPALNLTWNGADQDDVDALKYQIRLVSSGVTIIRGSTDDVDSGAIAVANGIVGSTAYEARAKFVVKGRATSWSSWIAATTATATYIPGLGTFLDNGFTLQDNGDPTKQLRFEVSGVATGTMKTLTAPNVNGTVLVSPGGTRAALVTWIASNTPAVGFVADAGEVSYRYLGSGTAISDMPGWVPHGDVTDDHFNGNLQAMRAYLDGLTNTEHGYVRGSVTHTTPVISDSDRSASISGMTVMSNINELGSATIYSGTGKSRSITSATNANPAVFTSAAHGFVAAERVYAKDVLGGTWDDELNGGPWLISGVTTNTFTLTNDLGTAFNGTTLGTLTGGTIRNEGAIAGWVLGGSFMQSYAGLAMRTSGAVEHIVWVHAENYVTTSGSEADFSGSLTRFDGVQFAPQTVDVTVAGVLIENHKFASFRDCWWIRGVSGSPGLKLGVARDQSPNTLIGGAAVHTSVDNNFIFANMVLENTEGLSIRNSQFDSTSFPVALKYAGLGVASDVLVYGCSFLNDGGADGTGLAALNQAPAVMTSPTLVWTSGWSITGNTYRDWPIGVKLEAGWASLTANNFRGRQAGDIGIVIGENVVGESIDHTNNFLQMLINGNQGIVDRRYKSVAVTGATAANPVVVTCSGGHHLNAGDRVRITSVSGMTQVNDKEFIVNAPTSTTFELYSVDDNGATSAAVDGTAYGAYVSGGSVTRPYHWHRQVVYGENWALGHGSFVFDLALDQNATLAAGNNTVLRLNGVIITGGFYEVVYSTTIDMAAVTGAVKFSVTIGGVDIPELYSAFEHLGAANTEVPWTFRKIIWMDGTTDVTGEFLRFRVNAPGAVIARGKASGVDGQTFMQIRRVT